MSKAMELVERLRRLNPDALLLEPRDYYDRALVGITTDPQDHWVREDKVWVAVYDCDLCIQAIQALLGPECPWEDSLEWFEYNTSGAWAGSGTPTFKHNE